MSAEDPICPDCGERHPPERDELLSDADMKRMRRMARAILNVAPSGVEVRLFCHAAFEACAQMMIGAIPNETPAGAMRRLERWARVCAEGLES